MTYSSPETAGIARVCTIDEIVKLNERRTLTIGEKYRVYRTNGISDDGWQLMAVDHTGRLLFHKEGTMFSQRSV